MNWDELNEMKVVEKFGENTDRERNNREWLNNRANQGLVVRTAAKSTVVGSTDANYMAAENLTLTKAQNSNRPSSHQESVRGCNSSDAELTQREESVWSSSTYGSGIAADPMMKQAAVKRGGVGSGTSGREDSEKCAMSASDVSCQLQASFGYNPSALGSWRRLSSENSHLRRWHLHRRERQRRPWQWHNYQHDQWQPHPSPPISEVLRGFDNSLLNLAMYAILNRPSLRLCDISLAIVATSRSACILQYDLAATLPAKPICSGSYSRTRLSSYSCSSENGNKEVNGIDCDRNGIDDFIESSTKWPDISKQVVRKQRWLGDYLKNSANRVRSDENCRSIECINIGDGGGSNASCVDGDTSVSENENCTNSNVSVAFYISNLEAIQKISDYFKKSLETDSQLRAGISDLKLDIELETRPLIKPFAAWRITGPSSLKDSVHINNNTNEYDNENQDNYESREDYSINCPRKDVSADHNDMGRYAAGKSDAQVEYEDDQDQVTSFIFSSWDSAFSENEDSENVDIGIRMKDEKKNSSIFTPMVKDVIVTINENKTEPPGILRSTLKRGSKKYSPKNCRVQFDENLNKCFEADYVILIPDNECDDDDNHEDMEYGWFKCGNQSCYESYRHVDFKAEENDDDFKAENHHHLSSMDNPTFNFTATLDSPNNLVTPSSLGDCKNRRYRPDSALTSFSNKVTGSTMTRLDGKHLFLFFSSFLKDLNINT